MRLPPVRAGGGQEDGVGPGDGFGTGSQMDNLRGPSVRDYGGTYCRVLVIGVCDFLLGQGNRRLSGVHLLALAVLGLIAARLCLAAAGIPLIPIGPVRKSVGFRRQNRERKNQRKDSAKKPFHGKHPLKKNRSGLWRLA